MLKARCINALSLLPPFSPCASTHARHKKALFLLLSKNPNGYLQQKKSGREKKKTRSCGKRRLTNTVYSFRVLEPTTPQNASPVVIPTDPTLASSNSRSQSLSVLYLRAPMGLSVRKNHDRRQRVRGAGGECRVGASNG